MEKYVSFWINLLVEAPVYKYDNHGNSGLEAMKTLVAKYPGGYEAWAEEHGELGTC
jgi:hypothetical protein